MKNVIILISILSSMSSWADLTLATNGKKVTCYADDNQTIEINAKRTAIKYTIEGESLGAKKISKIVIEDNKFASYKSSAGTLVFSKNGDTFKLDGENDAFTVKCN
jgi:hypothetical protein